MKRPLVPLLLGVIFIAGAVLINVQQRSIQRDDVRDITALRRELDSVSAALKSATAKGDSARLRENVTRRTEMLTYREFHVPSRQEAIDRWWTLTGPGPAITLVGVLLVGLAVTMRRRVRER